MTSEEVYKRRGSSDRGTRSSVPEQGTRDWRTQARAGGKLGRKRIPFSKPMRSARKELNADGSMAGRFRRPGKKAAPGAVGITGRAPAAGTVSG
eukprot:3442008-Heterocapsa_arctica.AAC.1